MNSDLMTVGFAPMMTIQQAVDRRNSMVDFVKAVMVEGVDFGTIPGTDKPTLYKPGSEKLCTLFGLAPKFSLVESEKDWTGAQHNGEAFFYFHYKCELLHSGTVVAEGDGSCNSWEKKYRWRNADRVCPQCGKPTIVKGKSEYGGGWLCFQKKGGCGAKFDDNAPSIVEQASGQVPNPDIADQVNTLQKMSQKRAFIAATLIAVNASEFFTQDIEDMVIDGSFTVHPPSASASSATSASAKVGGKISNDPATQFWAWVNEMKVDRRAATFALQDSGGDYDAAKRKLSSETGATGAGR